MNETVKMPKGITIEAKWKEAQVITGATISLTKADAIGLYHLTTTPIIVENDNGIDRITLDENEYNAQNQECRLILRNIAKAILLNHIEGGTGVKDLISKLK